MTQDSGKKIVTSPKPIKNSHGVKFLGLKSATSTPSRVTRSAAKIVSLESSGPAKRTRSMKIKHVVKRGTGKSSCIQDISEDFIPDPLSEDNQERDVVDAEAEQVIHNVLETLADVATAPNVVPNVESQVDRDSEPNSEANPSESDVEKEDDTNVATQESSSEKTPSVEMSHEKTVEPMSRKGKEPVLISSEEEVSDDEEVPTKASARKKATVSASKHVAGQTGKKKKKKDFGSRSLKFPTASQISVPEKKTKKEMKKERIAASTGRKRKHVATTDSEPEVEPDVPDISTLAKKRIKGKKIPLNVPEAPINNVSFHFASSAQSWKFVVQRLVIERELHADALELKKIMDLLVNAGLMKTVKDIDRCFTHLVRDFIMNIPTDCDDESSYEYRKVYVRGKCVNFSPEVVNEFLGRRLVAGLDEEPKLNRVSTTLTGKMVKKWPKKGFLPSGKLTTKYVVLFKIGCENWMSTNHLSGETPPLARMLYLIGTGGEFDFGKLVFYQTLKHAGSYAVRLSILFPCLLSELIVKQHPHVVRPDEPQGKKPMSLKFDYRLFVGTHVSDIMLSAAKGPASTSGTKAGGSSKDDILAELRAVSKSLDATIQASKIRKKSVDKLIQVLSQAPAAAEEGNSEDIAENVEDDSAAHEEEEAQYETAGEEEDASERDNEETDAEEAEDVTGSTSSSPRSTSL
ncbi:uncharacterized protein LOC130744091 [Lotus japonicus]|uniref:uncharacterized protein LOC130744091 n=1 Tax=Lotus japonicus TaxID=34305 RepID=UPI00258BCB9B|nr:uncharacterized protein LOC130744091 [Lotus japonicus]